ncbi:transcriptional regulator, IclR family [Herbiconiux ginsengi]|uniref:Glycerol operon regulatory protein n=1 Tax=Herbiconiux ginsengi TaxID=381665 RepID=A0A1H3TX47_9MICO|nr:transcriptional regulator, IclR family [Herbiconiux ginsengi]
MSRDDAGPDFVEAIARGVDVLRCFGESRSPMTLSEIATATGLARATARRIILTFEHLGYIRAVAEGYTVTPRVLELGTAHTLSSGIWELARLHLIDLVQATNQAASIAQLDGSDIIYVARVAVPKMVTLVVTVGMRLPAESTALGKVLLSSLNPDELDVALATPHRSAVAPFRAQDHDELRAELREIRARGWALTDEELHPGVRSVAAPLRNGEGAIFAAVNIAALASEMDLTELTDRCLPLLLRAAGQISADHVLLSKAPVATVASEPPL